MPNKYINIFIHKEKCDDIFELFQKIYPKE